MCGWREGELSCHEPQDIICKNGCQRMCRHSVHFVCSDCCKQRANVHQQMQVVRWQIQTEQHDGSDFVVVVRKLCGADESVVKSVRQPILYIYTVYVKKQSSNQQPVSTCINWFFCTLLFLVFFGTLISYKGSGKSLKNVFTRPVQSCVDAFGSMTSRVTSQGFACTRQHKLENRAPS